MAEQIRKQVVLDASVFFTDLPVEGELYTTPAVLNEIKTQTARMRLALLEEQGLRVHAPGPAELASVSEAARKSGDATVLSETDTGILALARELDAAVMTDDFAVQNTAGRLGIPVIPILQRRAKKRTWKYRCTGCGRYWSGPGVCQVCGAEIRRAGSGKKYQPLLTEHILTMSSLDELIGKAKLLHAEGHSPSQIADELSLSMETVTWLLTQQKDSEAPKDIHINWTVVGGNADMLRDAALLLLKRYYYGEAEARDCTPTDIPAPDLVVGVAHSGIPLATIIAAEEGAQFTMYHPKKHAQGDNPVGSTSGNFAPVQGRHCLVIDDVITSGNTMTDVINHLRNHGAVPEAVCVLFNKRNIQEIDGVPVYSLFQVSRID